MQWWLCRLIAVVVSVLLGGVVPSVRGQTAEELLVAGAAAFSAGNYAAAESAFTRFLGDYGASPEAAPQLERVLRLTGVCQIQLGRFEPALETIQRYLREHPRGEKAEEFAFWAGVVQLKLGEGPRAFAAFEQYLQHHPSSPRAEDARFNLGLALLRQDKFRELADHYAKNAPQRPDLRWQAALLRVHALAESGALDQALEALAAADPLGPGADTLASYHLLALNLGNLLMESGQPRKALSAFQRVWSRTRIATRQKTRLEAVQAEIARQAADPRSAGSYEAARMRETAARIAAELERMEKIPDYDTALQFRMARCFIELERHREAWLVLGRMAARLPDSDLLAQADAARAVCLVRMERWGEAVEAADAYARRFPESKSLPDVLYLKAESQMRLLEYAGAHATFTDLARRFPGHAQASRADFLAGYALLSQEKNAEAEKHFDALLERAPQGSFAEQAAYWRGMAIHFAKDYPRSREAFGKFLEDHPRSGRTADAAFRRAQALFNQKQFTEAYKELEAFLKKHPGSLPFDEACNLLGDCYLAMGEIERGLEAYARVSGRDARLLEYGLFRKGQALKAQEDFEGMRDHFQKFIQERPRSPRLSEALAQLAWAHRRLDRPEKAREIYWKALAEHGNDPEAAAVEDMLRTLGRMHREPSERQAFAARLSDLEAEAAAEGRATLAARALWMRAQLAAPTDPELAVRLRLRAAEIQDPRQLSPLLLADFGDALRGAGQAQKAETYYRTLLTWYPRSLLKDRAYAGLGLLARSQGKDKAALDHFARFEREAAQSPLMAEVLRARADLLVERGQVDDAVKDLEAVLALPAAKGRPWVEALYRIGEIRLKQGDPQRAVPYFQRIYVMYGRWTDLVAKAYWQSGQAFEKLNMPAEAVKTYQEFTGQQHLSGTPEFGKAQERLRQTGGGES